MYDGQSLPPHELFDTITDIRNPYAEIRRLDKAEMKVSPLGKCGNCNLVNHGFHQLSPLSPKDNSRHHNYAQNPLQDLERTHRVLS